MKWFLRKQEATARKGRKKTEAGTLVKEAQRLNQSDRRTRREILEKCASGKLIQFHMTLWELYGEAFHITLAMCRGLCNYYPPMEW